MEQELISMEYGSTEIAATFELKKMGFPCQSDLLHWPAHLVIWTVLSKDHNLFKRSLSILNDNICENSLIGKDRDRRLLGRDEGRAGR